MNVAIINGSPRRNGATGLLLKRIETEIAKERPDFKIQYYDLAEINYRNCRGCGKCYQWGTCALGDGLDAIASEIKKCDGIIVGSPMHGSNISAVLKNFWDRGHFIVEQSLYDKACFSLLTYEIADGRSPARILNKSLVVSGGKLRNKLLMKNEFNKNPLDDTRTITRIKKEVSCFINHMIKQKRKPLFQYLFNNVIVVRTVWAKYFKRHPEQFMGIIKKYRENDIYPRLTGMKVFDFNKSVS